MKKGKQLIVLVGNIASGKTTLAKKYVKKGYVSISRDGLRYSIGSGKYIFYPPYERTIRLVELFMLKEFMKLGVNIVIDEVGINRWTRQAYNKLARAYKYKMIAIIMPKISIRESLKRRLKDGQHGNQGKKIWTEVWNSFDMAYEEPTKEEGFDKIVRLRK